MKTPIWSALFWVCILSRKYQPACSNCRSIIIFRVTSSEIRCTRILTSQIFSCQFSIADYQLLRPALNSLILYSLALHFTLNPSPRKPESCSLKNRFSNTFQKQLHNLARLRAERGEFLVREQVLRTPVRQDDERMRATPLIETFAQHFIAFLDVTIQIKIGAVAFAFFGAFQS